MRKQAYYGSLLTVKIGMAEPAADVEDEPGKDEHSHAEPDPPVCNIMSKVAVGNGITQVQQAHVFLAILFSLCAKLCERKV